MHDEQHAEFWRVPGLFRLWDLQFVISRDDEYQINYAELTEDGAPLFAVYRRPGSLGARDTRVPLL